MLSKGDLLAFRQCPRRLWLEHRQPDVASTADPDKHLLFRYGKMVGEQARAALGNNVVWPAPDADIANRAAATWQLLVQKPDASGVETPFLRDGLHCRADAVIRSNGHFRLQETKASTFPLKADKVTPGKPKPHYVEDAAIQLWAAGASGLPVSEVELNLLDNQFVYQGDDDYAGLFRTLDISDEAQALSPEIPQWIAQATQVLEGDLPSCQTGDHCNEPYACPFQAHCASLQPAPNPHPLTLLPDSAGKKLAKKLGDAGYASLLDVPPDELTGSGAELYQRIQHAHVSGEAVLEPGTKEIFSAHPYPRYFLDFEGINFPIPRWAGVRPYQQVAFQWSCHVERQPGIIDHDEFLDTSGDDPSLGCIETLLGFIDATDEGPIYVYNAMYERGQLKDLAYRHPQYADSLLAIVERMIDLFPMVKSHYYHPAMKGGFSLKRVLPVIAPDLSYGNLQDVQQGIGAQNTYVDLVDSTTLDDERRLKLRTGLLAYCKQDTWALIELAYFLEGRGRPQLPASH